LEAMARANAVVSSATEGGRYLIKERVNGFIFPYGNLAQLKKSLLQLSNHASLLKRIQHANLSKAKQFTWEKIAPQLEFIYCRLLNNKMQ
ncbi:MAG TPA: glycosyltransferase, partial [Candidatus Nanoarchaeia archaeon]|nr:glycosyltransferase [Candidatus Nanoarchaeia archaeon]